VASESEFDLEWDENDELMLLFQDVSHALRRARDAQLRKFGISYAEAGILFYLYSAADPMTPTDLARLLFKEHHNISALIRRMEAKGLVEKTRDSENKKSVRVRLTNKGREVRVCMRGVTKARKPMSSLSKQQRHALKVPLEKLQAVAHELLQELWPGQYK